VLFAIQLVHGGVNQEPQINAATDTIVNIVERYGFTAGESTNCFKSEFDQALYAQQFSRAIWLLRYWFLI
jgi:hypothetical protein